MHEKVDIIILDDDMVGLTMLKQLAEKLPDCMVREFVHPAVALAWCKQNDIDLVIVGDLVSSTFDGVEFTRGLRALPGRADTPVLMVTANADSDGHKAALQNGVNELLTKPFGFAQLQPLATNMLAVRAAQKRQRAEMAGARRKALLDTDMTLQRLAGDQTLLANVAAAFIRTAPALLASIETALVATDLKRVSVQAHALKCAVAALEAPVVFNCVVNVEKHARSEDAPAAAAAFRLAKELVRRLLTEIRPLAPPDAEFD
jgi:CheY-like chemotaxis protein